MDLARRRSGSLRTRGSLLWAAMVADYGTRTRCRSEIYARATELAAAAAIALPPYGDLAQSDAVHDERAEHLAHWLGIPAHDHSGGPDVADRIKVLPGEREPGGAGELPEESPLRPPVALAEWIQALTSPR